VFGFFFICYRPRLILYGASCTYLKVKAEDFTKKFMLRSLDCFDYKPIILRKVEKAATFARRSNLRKGVFASEGNLNNTEHHSMRL
jgi:hypothetical protein